MDKADQYGFLCFQFGLSVDPDDLNHRVPIMAWNTCAYTIVNLGKISYLHQLLRYSLPELNDQVCFSD